MPELTTSAAPAESTSSSSSPASSSPSTPTSSAPVRNLVNKVAALSAGAIAYVPPSVTEKVAQFGSPLVDAADLQLRAASDRLAAAQVAMNDKIGAAKAQVVSLSATASERFAATKQQADARVEVALAAVKQSMETLQTTLSQFRPAAKPADAAAAPAEGSADAPAAAPTKSLIQTKLAELQTSFAGAVEKANEIRCASHQRVMELYSNAIAATTNATANASAMTNAQAQLALAKVAEVQAKVQELVKSLTAKKEKAAEQQGEAAPAPAAEVPAQ